MALTPEEIVSAELDLIDFDGTFAQFSTSAIRDFMKAVLDVQIAAYDGNVIVRLLENNVLTNADDFGNFTLFTTSQVLVYAGGVLQLPTTLGGMANPSAGVYEIPFTPQALDFEVQVNIAAQFKNPATANNGQAFVDLTIPFQESLAAANKTKKVFDGVDFATGFPSTINI